MNAVKHVGKELLWGNI